MTPSDLIDLPGFLHALRGERQPTVLVHGPPLCGKTRFAQGIAQKAGWGYFDGLAVLSEHSELIGQIDRFDIPNLKRLLLEFPTIGDILLVDELDFLFPLWGNLSPFKELVRTLNAPTGKVAFAFFVQSRPDWDNWELLTAARQSRVIEFENIKSL